MNHIFVLTLKGVELLILSLKLSYLFAQALDLMIVSARVYLFLQRFVVSFKRSYLNAQVGDFLVLGMHLFLAEMVPRELQRHF